MDFFGEKNQLDGGIFRPILPSVKCNTRVKITEHQKVPGEQLKYSEGDKEKAFLNTFIRNLTKIGLSFSK